MDKKRFIAAACAAALLIGLAALPALAYPLGGSGPGEYVALGDSYSAGEGLNNDYYDGTDVADNRCHRSASAYGPRIAQALTDASLIAESRWLFPACSGDTSDMLFSGSGNDDTINAVPQLDYLDHNTKFVTLTIGGNDVDFPVILAQCLEKFQEKKAWWYSKDGEAGCTAALDNADAMVADQWDGLPSRLVKTYRTILQRAPHARIVLLTYPPLFPEADKFPGRTVGSRKYCVALAEATSSRDLGFRSETIQRFNNTTKAVNGLIAQLAEDLIDLDGLGGRVTLARADIGEIATHPFACGDPGQPQEFINGLRFGPSGDDGIGPGEQKWISKASFHPNAAGQLALATLVAGVITPGERLGLTVAGDTSLRAGTSGEVVVTAHNGAPTWNSIDGPAARASYPTMGFGVVPASGLVVKEVFRSSLTSTTVTFDAPTPGTYAFEAMVIDAAGITARRSFVVEVAGTLAIATESLPAGNANSPYAATLAANDAVGPLSWSAQGLPSGLAMDATTGELRGMPTTAGTFSVAVTVNDGTSTANRTFSLEIGAALGRSWFHGSSYFAAMSRDGRWLVDSFPTSSGGEIRLRSTLANSDGLLLARSPSGTASGCVQPHDAAGISGDGRFVSFTSCARLLPADTNSVDDVYRYDRTSASLALVPGTSRNRAGPVSDDGRYVVVLAPTSTEPLYGSLWRVEVATGARARIDTTSTGADPDRTFAFLDGVALSGDSVLFSTNATNLDPADTDFIADLYIKHMATGAVSAITAGVREGSERLRAAWGGTISDDGRLVALGTAGSIDGQWRQMVLDRSTGESIVVSRGANRPRISADGSTMAYTENHIVPATPGLGGSDATFYEASHRGAVTTGPLAVTDAGNLSLYTDGSEPTVYGSRPSSWSIGLSADGNALLWRSSHGLGTSHSGGYLLHRIA